MIWLSAALVLSVTGWIVSVTGTVSPDLAFGHEQAIHARVPWLVLGGLWVGGALGIASLFRSRRWFSWVVVVAEAVPVLFFSLLFLKISYLPESTLKVAAGDAFPTYSLPDQDEVVHAAGIGEPRPAALYIFYRGDW